jgi:uncharacterized protein YcbK (DUF882 family)
MGDLSKNFSRWEFACHGDHCCDHSAPVHPALVAGLQSLRETIERPLTISSGFRCRKHNRAIHGSKDSQHCLGMAADIEVPESLTADELAQIAQLIPAFYRGGIGTYATWIHVDVRDSGPVRWQV